MAEIKEEKMNLEATIENTNVVLAKLEEMMEQAEASMKAINAAQLAVEELYVNVANYAYEGSGKEGADRTCRVVLRTIQDSEAGRVEIELRDSGAPFNPFEREDPDITLSIQERQIGGLGIFMTKRLMDSVEYRREGSENVVRLLKRW